MLGTVTLLDVTPRDGLQDAPAFVPLSEKQALLQGLAAAGIRKSEATSFVHPRWVPMLPDAEEVMQFARGIPHVQWIALVPNLRGLERALAIGGASAITVVCSASEAHNQANLNRTREQTLHELERVVDVAHQSGVAVRGALSTTFDCPFSGTVTVDEVAWVAERMLAIGVDEISVADTMGTADPQAVCDKLSAINQIRGQVPVSLHLHDRHGQALDNVQMALELGVRQFEAALGGLGGCPYAPGAAGNVDAERLIPFLEERGWSTGIDVAKLAAVRQRLVKVLSQGLPAPRAG